LAKRKIRFYQYILYILEYIVVVPLATLVSWLPWRIAYFLADVFSSIYYKLDKHFRDVAFKSLDIIFSNSPLSLEKKENILKNLYKNVAYFGVEYIKSGWINKNNYKKYAFFENLDYLEEALSYGKGVIVVTAHLGNWEYLGSIPAKLGKNAAVIINRQFNPFTDHWLKRIREKKGKLKCFYNEVGDIFKISRHIKEGGIIGLVVDQTYYFKPIFVPFFGVQAATADGPARFHLKYGAPIVMAFSIREPDGRYRMTFEKGVFFEKTEDFENDCKKIMTWINSRYEEYIRKYPDQWFSLIHGRWERNKPEDFENIDWNPY